MARKRRKGQGRVPPTRAGQSLPPSLQLTVEEQEQTALHEASHLVAAHAVGRRLTYARIRPVFMAANHPLNRTNAPAWSVGYTANEPLLAAEVNAQHASGQPLTPEHREWLTAEAIISFAGALSEGQPNEAAADDLAQVGNVAAILGHVAAGPEGTQVQQWFQLGAMEAARAILNDRLPVIERVANELLTHEEMDADALAAAVADCPRGSHHYLVVGLQERGNEGAT